MKNKYLIFFFAVFFGLVGYSLAHAQEAKSSVEIDIKGETGLMRAVGEGNVGAKGQIRAEQGNNVRVENRNQIRINEGMGEGNPNDGRPFIRGEVTAINDGVITISTKAIIRVKGEVSEDENEKVEESQETKVYTVNTTNASFYVDGTESTLSEIAVGDTIMIEGTLSGSVITATKIHEGNVGNGNRANDLDKDELAGREKNNRSIWVKIGSFFSGIFGKKNK